MVKQYLLELIDFIRYKVENDKCTTDEMKSVYKLLSENIECDATITDMAEFYGQSESNIRNVVSRNWVRKPKRKVLYNFPSVVNIVPKKWREKFSDLR